MQILIEQLRRARAENHLSQRELSARTGLTQSNISLIENGSTEPGINTVVQLARALDLELMLVPKRYIPAVIGIMRSPTNPGALTPETGSAMLTELKRGERLVKKLTAQYGEQPDLLKIGATLRDMRRLNVRADELNQVTDALNTLRDHQASPQASPVVREVGERLRRLRNNIIHQPPATVRSAYGEDEDDDA
ncbi:transcriptional regulator with XRE-family HTH domain [Devosia sp. UYZn731]|uniref:helix-turn-helix domain-containing protein n=1 Tax=Devosia sp. UYZn731 TaxID=3156345 RepID=UPI003393BBFE